MVLNYKNIFILLTIINCLLFFSSELITSKTIESEKNIEDGYSYIKPPKFSKRSGFYPENFKLILSSEENITIYFTVDSTDPRTSLTSKIFKDYILIYDKSSEENIYSSINTTEIGSANSICLEFPFEPPFYPVDKAMVIRAVTKNIKGEFSEIISQIYFITTDNLLKYSDFTVISVITNPENLFDPEKGIYVVGVEYEKWKNSDEFDPYLEPWDINSKCNYYMKGKEWEREANVTIFDKSEIKLEQNLGIRIKGGATRNNPAKSFNLFARKKYGKSIIETDLFKDNYDINGNLIISYKSLSLRAIYEEVRLREKFGRDLFFLRKGLTTTQMKVSILFLNGEYWGVYIIQEKLDKDFLGNKYLIPSKDIVFAKDNKIEDGPEEELVKFKQFCEEYSQKDLSDENIYNDVKNHIDINSLIEMFGTGIYISNMDWPAKNDGEWKYIGENNFENEYKDGKWRFLIFDLDYSMGAKYHGNGSPGIDNFNYANRRNIESPVNLFFSLLKKNKYFQNEFINIYSDYANDIFNLDKINKLIEKYKEEFTEIMVYSILRWWWGYGFDSFLEGYSYSKTDFLKGLDSIVYFFEERPKYTLRHMKEFLDLKGDLFNLNITIIGKGKIQINTIIPTFIDNKWSGKYFSLIPISLKAISASGYSFNGWTGHYQNIEKMIEIVLYNDTEIVANFVN